MRYENGFALHKVTGFLVIALFICAMQFITPKVYGQLPCTMANDTCTSPWVTVLDTMVLGPCDVNPCNLTCKVEVLYAYRICGGFQDLQMLSIKFNPDSCDCD